MSKCQHEPSWDNTPVNYVMFIRHPDWLETRSQYRDEDEEYESAIEMLPEPLFRALIEWEYK